MDFAFWRRNKRLPAVAKGLAPRPSTAVEEDGVRAQDPAAALRGRARRRLIGAAALLLAVAIVVPMLLDPEPRPIADNIAIDIPSESVPFTPRLSLPPTPAADSPADTPPADTPVASVAPAVPASAAPATAASQPKPLDEKKRAIEPRKSSTVDKATVDKGEEQRARALLDGRSANGATKTVVAKSGSFAVQAAATANETAARDLAERLHKAGFKPYLEKTETKEGIRHRVRVGPYASRDEAERARLKLKALGISGQLVAL